MPHDAVARMMPLTTAQRDLLQHLLVLETPISATALGEQLHLTQRQVQYGLRDVKGWLDRRLIMLRHTPGVGVQIVCTADQRQRLLRELDVYARFQLVLTPEQRQQLLALQLLASNSALTLGQFQNDLGVARATILKDLEAIEPWLASFGLEIARRQHRGCWIDGAELAQRQALAALLWGDVPFPWPIMGVRQGSRLEFVLARDEALLPIVQRVNDLVRRWDLATAQQIVGLAETALGGRFSDIAAAALAVTGAVQQQRIQAGQYAVLNAATLEWAQAQAEWPVAAQLAADLWPALPAPSRTAESAMLAMQLAAGARDEPWQSTAGVAAQFAPLINRMLAQVAAAYRVPELAADPLLQHGLEAHVLPAYVRQRFGLWSPPNDSADLHGDRYTAERTVAAQLAADAEDATGLPLPAAVYDDLILLLRAAIVRARPERARHILVVCPSGMATTQLLVARLRARFPRLGTFEVLPMREITTSRVANADLIISTVPLILPDDAYIDVIQVHPMLRADDIVRLTQWMA